MKRLPWFLSVESFRIIKRLIVSLPRKVLFTLGGLLLVSLLSGTIGFLGVNRMSGLIVTMMDENLPSVRAANELKISMLRQRGLVGSYVLDDGNSKWRKEIEETRDAFDRSLRAVRASVFTVKEQDILRRIELTANKYNEARDLAIRLFDLGEHEQVVDVLMTQTPLHYEETSRACDELIAANVAYMNTISNRVKLASDRLWYFSLITYCSTISLAGFLIVLLGQRIYLPLKRLASEAKQYREKEGIDELDSVTDDLSTVGRSLTLLANQAAVAQDNLARGLDYLRKAEKRASMGKISADIAHDIRSLLTTMKLWSYSLKDMTADDGTFETMREEFERLEQSIRHCLKFEPLPELKLERHNLVDLVDRAMLLIHPRLAAKSIKLDKQFCIDLPPVMADAQQLKQVFVNLLTNACDASDAGGEITIRALRARSFAGADCIMLRITNFGSPIPGDVQARIFEPFLTTKKNGVGLGLAIAAGVANRHGGELKLVSSTLSGTEFALCLPVCQKVDDGKNTAD